MLLGWAAFRNSATFDEPAHLAAGVEYWRHHDFSIYDLSPPLLRLWAAMPAVLAGAEGPSPAAFGHFPPLERHWQYADAFVAANLTRFPHLLLLSRLAMVPISCLAGWIVFRWAGRLYSKRSGVAACAMYCLNPSLLAHGALVTTDVGTAAAMLAACWLWWRFCRSPSLIRFAVACLAATTAHLCKFTAFLLWPMLLAMALPFVQWRLQSRRWLLPGAWALMATVTLILLNAVYGFAGTARPLGSYQFGSTMMQHLQQHLPSWLPVPAPARLVVGFDAQKNDTQEGYQGFLFGEIYRGAKWYFYPAALLCKLPIAMLLLLAAAVASKIAPRGAAPPARGAGEWSVFFALAVFAAGVMSLGDLNIGTRYLLPAFPLAIVLVSRLWSVDRSAPAPRPAARQPSVTRTRPLFPYLRDALVGLLAIESLWVAPRFLTFVNFAVGGPANGWRLLSDSDYDWGQGLIDLHQWMTSHNVPSVALAYFGFVNPHAYGIQFKPLIHPGDDQFVAVSSYFLDGLENRIWVDENQRRWIALPFYRQLQAKQPLDVVANTIFIYSMVDTESASQALPGPGEP